MDWVSYPEYRRLLKKAKCILDIIPPNTDCSTLRVNEAMSHKCKILTNNKRIVYEEFYDSNNISVYENPEDIDINFLLEEYSAPDYGENIIKMGPKALIQHLDKVLYRKGE